MSPREPDGTAPSRRSRRSKRAKRRLTCSFAIGSQYYRGITVDLSAEGLFIQTDATAAPGNRVEIDLIGTGKDPDVRVSGVIARRRAVPAMLASAVRRGIGVRLLEAPREYGLLYQDEPLEHPLSLRQADGNGSGTGLLPPLALLSEEELDGALEEEAEEKPATRALAEARPAPDPAEPPPPGLARPDVLLMDDGSLGAIAELLVQVGAKGLRIRATRGSSPNAWVRPARLLIAPASLALSFPWPESRDEPPFVGIAVANDDTQTLATRIERLGFQHLVRRSIHPETLRCLLRKLLYRGPERRRVPRFALDCAVAGGGGLRRSPARVVDLSARGCRILMSGEVPDLPSLARITLLPDPTERGLGLRGRVVRRERNPHAGNHLSLAIAFERPSARARRRLDALLYHCADGHVHPPRSRLALAPFLVPIRPASAAAPICAPEPGALVGDLSIAGVTTSCFHPGLRFALELFESPYSEPLHIGAEVFKQDALGSLGLRFVDPDPRPGRRGSDRG